MITDHRKIRNRVKSLFSGIGDITGTEYDELRTALNDLVREARKEEWMHLPEQERPDTFLLELFRTKIFHTTFDFIRNYGFLKQAQREQITLSANEDRDIRLEETTIFREWLNISTIITQNIILGDATPRKDRLINGFLKEFDRSEDKILFLDNRTIKADRDALLGQEGTHKENPEEIYRTSEYHFEARIKSTFFDWHNPWSGLEDTDNESGFAIRDLEAQRVAAGEARMRKGYNPDYIEPELKYLLDLKEMATFVYDQWKRGEIPEQETEADCLAYLKSDFTDGLSLEDLQKSIDGFPPSRPDLVIYIFGRLGGRGKLYEKLRDFFDSRYTKENYADAEKKKTIITESALIRELENEEDANETENIGSVDLTFEDSIIERDIERKFRSLLSQEQLSVWRYTVEDLKTPQEIAILLGQTERNIQKHLRNIRHIRDKFTQEN